MKKHSSDIHCFLLDFLFDTGLSQILTVDHDKDVQIFLNYTFLTHHKPKMLSYHHRHVKIQNFPCLVINNEL